MTEVSDHMDDLPEGLVELVNKAQNGSVSPSQFLQALEEHGISGIQKLLYAHKVFNLPLKNLKEIEQARGHGLTDLESEALARIVDELDG